MKKQTLKQISQQWERAVEQAQADMVQQPNFDQASLNTVAGLHLQSGVRAGSDWSSPPSYTCGDGCSMVCVH